MKFSLKQISRKQMLIGAGVIALLALVIIRNTGGNNETRQSGPPLAVQIARVKLSTVEETVSAAGKIQPVFETEISSTVSAQIMDLRVREGDEVQPGDTLVILDRLRYEAALGRAKSAVRSAKANLRKVDAELNRSKQLFDKNLISLQDLEALEATHESALSQREQAEATLDQAKDDLSKTALLAPEKGVITKINKEVGEMALGSTFQADVLLIISDLSMMEVVVEVDETDVVNIENLDPVEVEVDAIRDTVFTGRVSQIAHSATVTGLGSQDQVTNFEVVVTLDMNLGADRIDSRIRPGMSATATIVTARHSDVVSVPIQALTVRAPVQEPDSADASPEHAAAAGKIDGPRADAHNSQKGGGPDREAQVEVVFVVTPDSTSQSGFFAKLLKQKKTEVIRQREVKLGISSDTHYEVLSGLEEGEEIVTGNYRAVSRELQDGHLITRKEGGGRGRDRKRPDK